MKKIKLYYGIHNCGDGSASLSLYETKKLASWDQDYQNSSGDGFAEDCSGSIVIDLTNNVSGFNISSDKVWTALSYFVTNTLEEWDWESEKSEWNNHKKFLKEFFPEGLPQFIVRFNNDDESYYDIFSSDDNGVSMKYVTKEYAYDINVSKVNRTEDNRLKLERFLNGLRGI